MVQYLLVWELLLFLYSMKNLFIKKIVYFLIGSILASVILAYRQGYLDYDFWRTNIKEAELCHYLNVTEKIKECESGIFYKIAGIGGFQDTEISFLELKPGFGYIDKVSYEPDGEMFIFGWAANVEKAPADFVYIYIEYDNGESYTAIEAVDIPRRDVLDHFGSTGDTLYGWSTRLHVGENQNKNYSIKAWAIDMHTLNGYPLM